MSIPLAATSVQISKRVLFCLNFSRFSVRSLGDLSECKQTPTVILRVFNFFNISFIKQIFSIENEYYTKIDDY
jgi:hypothetical protein